MVTNYDSNINPSGDAFSYNLKISHRWSVGAKLQDKRSAPGRLTNWIIVAQRPIELVVGSGGD